MRRFGSVFAKTLREGRIAILGWGIGMGLLMFEIQAAVGSLLSNGSEKSTITSLASSFNWAGDPVALNTVGGYATWKNGIVIILTAIWPIVGVSRIFRGSEERGTMDMLLTQPRGRLRSAVESILAVWTSLLAMAAIIALLTYAGGRSSGAVYTLADALLFGLNLALLCGVFASIALLIGQFTTERSVTSGVTGGLLFLFIVLDMLNRVVPGTTWLSRISPVYYYNLNKPLVVSFAGTAGVYFLLLGISVVLSAGAVVLFLRRDIGGSVPLPRWVRPLRGSTVAREALPTGAWSLRSFYARSIMTIIRPTVWWTIGIAGFAGFMVVVVRQMEDKLAALASGSSLVNGLITKVGGGGGAATNALFLSALFIFLPMLSMAFAITQSTRWASDEEEGRHELLLTTPHHRLQLMLGRFAAVASAALFIGVVTLAVSLFASKTTGLALDMGNLVAATLAIIPQCLLMAALGYLFAGWLRTAVEAGLLGFLLVFWFFLSFVGPELGWLKGVLELSSIYYYGTPLVHGLAVGDTLVVLGVGAAALIAASLRYVLKDVGRT